MKPRQGRKRREGRKEVRIRHDVLLLPDAIVPKRRHRIGQAKTIIENPETRPGHGFWCEAPRNGDPRREVMAVTYVRLRLLTETETQGQRPLGFPVRRH